MTVIAGDPATTGRGADLLHLDTYLGGALTFVGFDPSRDQLELGTAAYGPLGSTGPLDSSRFIHDSGTFTGGYSSTLTPGMNAAFDAQHAVIVQDATGTVYYDPGRDGPYSGYYAVAHLDHPITAAAIHLHP